MQYLFFILIISALIFNAIQIIKCMENGTKVRIRNILPLCVAVCMTIPYWVISDDYYHMVYQLYGILLLIYYLILSLVIFLIREKKMIGCGTSLILLPTMITLIVWLCLNTGFSNIFFTKNLEVKSQYSYNKMDLPLYTTRFWYFPGKHAVMFRTDKSMEELKQYVVAWDSSAETKIYESSLFISRKNEDGTKDYYYIFQDVDTTWDNPEHSYIINDLVYSILSLSEDHEDSYEQIAVLTVPVHLFEMKSKRGGDEGQGPYTLEAKKKYELIDGCDINDIYDFYAQSNYFDVEKLTDRIIIRMDVNNNVANLKYPIEIVFANHDQKQYVSFQRIIEDGDEAATTGN